ncbi:MAG TPA: glycosyltransferase family 2 protein [Usitatibacter sp.]|nr:glycosyltransferase family 2 protein [Usitatibacter sp.]
MAPRVTVAVPSFNHARFLEQTLRSVFEQGVAVEVFVMDAGSNDGTLDVIGRYQERLAGWRSHPDAGQAAAINEGIARGTAPYVCWLNSDDWWLADALPRLLAALEPSTSMQPGVEAPFAFGRVWNYDDYTQRRKRNLEVRPFREKLFAQFCTVSQPATLIRRSAWEAVGGLDESLHYAMDYDLWWRLYRRFGAPVFVDEYLAINRRHRETKTTSRRREHYEEAIDVVRRHYGRVPLKWYLAQPFAVWLRSRVRR